jgi:hypothetical protein
MTIYSLENWSDVQMVWLFEYPKDFGDQVFSIQMANCIEDMHKYK